MTGRARPRILFLWELGANFGHASKIARVARPLTAHADVIVAARDPAGFRRFVGGLDVPVLAAPFAHKRKPTARHDVGRSYPDDLRHCGWGEPETLAALLESWRALYRLADPDVIVAQAAPTALLAARGGGWRTAILGSGYDAPPRASPMPRFFFWEPQTGRSDAALEEHVVAIANAALAKTGDAPLSTFSDVLTSDLFLLACFEEIDPYRPRDRWEAGHPGYLGQLFDTATGRSLDWKTGDRKRIFAYLRPGSQGFAETEAALAQADRGWDVILAAPGIADESRERLERAGQRVVDGPVRLDRVLEGCDLAITHGSNGTAAAALAAGVPQIALPTHAEQVMTARALGEQGLALGMAGHYGPAQVLDLIERGVAPSPFKERCRAAAARIARGYPADPADVMTERLQRLANARR